MTLPRLDRVRPATRRPVTGAVLLLHGGRPEGREAADGLRLPFLRMVPFARALAAAGAHRGVDTALLRYRHRGWNAPDLDPVQDAGWAVHDIRRRHGDVPVVLVGHSMGGRAALRLGGENGVVGVAALAPWIERGEPYAHLVDQTVLIAHGDRERTTSPRASRWFAGRVATVSDRVARFEVLGDGHAMLRRAAAWHALVTRFALGALGLAPFPEPVSTAMRAGDPDGLAVPLGTRRERWSRPTRQTDGR